MTQRILLDDFSPGLHTREDARAIPLGAGRVVENLNIDRGDLRLREGRTIHGRCPVGASAPVRALAELFVSGATVEHRFVAVIGTKIYWLITSATAPVWTADTVTAVGHIVRPTVANGYIYEATAVAGDTKTHATTQPTWPTIPYQSTGYSSGDWTVVDDQVTWVCHSASVFEEIDSSIAVHATNKVRMAQFGDKLYIADGDGPVLELDSAGHFRSLDEFPAPTVAPSVGDNYTPTVIDDSQTTNTTNGRTGADRGFYWTGSSWYNTSLWNNGVWVAYQSGTTPNSSELYGVTVRRLEDDANTFQDPDTGPASNSIALEFVAKNGVTTDVSCGDVYMIKKLPSAIDLTDSTAIEFSIRVYSADGSNSVPTSMKFVMGEGDTISGWTELTCDVSTLNNDANYDITVDISGVASDTKNAIRWIGVKFDDIVWDVIDRVEYDSGSDFGGVNSKAAWIVFSPFEANESTAALAQGTYEFTYTYYDTIDGVVEESAEYINLANFEHPYAELLVGAAVPSDLSITVSRDLGSGADGAYIYARAAASGGEWRRIGTVTFSPDDGTATTAALTGWTGTFEADDEFLTEYVGPPPEGVTMLCPFRNRMVYVAPPPVDKWVAGYSYPIGAIVRPTTRNGYVYRASTAGTTGATEPSWAASVVDSGVTWVQQAEPASDTIYLSNYGDPRRVPIKPSSLKQTPATYGGWVDPEREGADLTGIAPYGAILLAFKKQGIWAVTGDPGELNFDISEVNRVEGCLSHESLVQAGNLLIWVGNGKILAWDGSGLTDISDAIAPTVSALTTASTSFSTYDPVAARVFITFPSSATPGTSPASTTLSYQFRAGGQKPAWVTWTGQPGSCALYSIHAPTSGLYAADLYGTSGRGKLFRITSAATTDSINFGDAASISWAWVSGEVSAPKRNRTIEVADVRGLVLCSDATGPWDMATGLYPNNVASSVYSRNAALYNLRTTSDGYFGTVLWNPPARTFESFALRLARGTTTVLGIRQVEITVNEREGLR